MEGLRALIADKTTAWQILIDTCNLTPRLKEQMQSAIKLQTLLQMSNAIEDRWRQIYGSTSETACLQKYMLLFREFLRSKLLEDYVGTPCFVDNNVVRLGRIKGGLGDRERAAREFGAEVDDLDDIYRQRGIWVLDELMLDRAFVESKMRAAVARDGRPGSDIQPLIDRCDWGGLAAVLQKDEALVMRLFERGADKEKKVQRSLGKVRKKYFRELNSELDFVPSKYASRLEAKYLARLPVTASTSDLHGTATTSAGRSEEDGIFS